MRNRRAFTLVELVLSVIIVGLLAGIAVPRMANALRRYRLDLAARRVIADMQLTRTQAMRDKADRTISFDIPHFRYTLQGQSGNRVDSSGYVVTLKVSDGSYVRLISADFNGSSDLTYDKFGVPASGGTVVLGDGHEYIVLTVSGTTGRVKRTRQTG